MTKLKKILFAAIVGLVVGLIVGFLSGKKIYNRPLNTKVERDTVTLWDTIPQYFPQPLDGTDVRKDFKFLPLAIHDTLSQVDTLLMHDSVLVAVPITSKHYGNETYDAYVSGYLPSLDSIFVHQKTEYITERITESKPPNKFSLDVMAGAEYFTNDKKLYPYIRGNFGYNINERWSIGVNGGVYKSEKTEPFGGGYVKLRLF